MWNMNRVVHSSGGVWGAIARHAPARTELAEALVKELQQGLAVLKTLPAAVTFFGGSRVTPEDPYYAAAERMGELLAETGIPPRTGAGPGIMTAVPEGFRRRLQKMHVDVGATTSEAPASRVTGRPQALTQGFNIRLPFEQAVNPAIDVSLELVHFPTRKLMLYENSFGVVIFPGGFGTLDELFEMWRLKAAGRLQHPFVLFGCSFWQPITDVLRSMTRSDERATVSEDIFSLVEMTDDPDQAVWDVTGKRVHAFDEGPESLGSRIAHELVEGLGYLESLPPAVTVLGGSRLTREDPAVRACELFAERLAAEGWPTRAAGPGAVSVALARGGHRGARFLPQQAFGMRREDARNLYGADRVHLVNDRLTHKVLLTENARAFVVLPGGLGTLDELFSILCQLQTRKIEMRRIILFGPKFWRPMLDVLKEQMLAAGRHLIGPADLELMTLVDDPDEVARLALAPPPTVPPRASA
jgi:uncharacterized protein (TIGR00730 family)